MCRIFLKVKVTENSFENCQLSGFTCTNFIKLLSSDRHDANHWSKSSWRAIVELMLFIICFADLQSYMYLTWLSRLFLCFCTKYNGLNIEFPICMTVGDIITCVLQTRLCRSKNGDNFVRINYRRTEPVIYMVTSRHSTSVWNFKNKIKLPWPCICLAPWLVKTL